MVPIAWTAAAQDISGSVDYFQVDLSIPRDPSDVEVSTQKPGGTDMAQYAVLIYAHDSAHSPDATPEDLQTCDHHAEELTADGSMIMCRT